jgi:hypothetical protein
MPAGGAGIKVEERDERITIIPNTFRETKRD